MYSHNFFYNFYIVVFFLTNCYIVCGLKSLCSCSDGFKKARSIWVRKKGACLALVDRRQEHLEIVAETSRKLGSGNVIIIPGDVASVDDCKKFTDETIHHFGRRKYL